MVIRETKIVVPQNSILNPGRILSNVIYSLMIQNRTKKCLKMGIGFTRNMSGCKRIACVRSKNYGGSAMKQAQTIRPLHHNWSVNMYKMFCFFFSMFCRKKIHGELPVLLQGWNMQETKIYEPVLPCKFKRYSWR